MGDQAMTTVNTYIKTALLTTQLQLTQGHWEENGNGDPQAHLREWNQAAEKLPSFWLLLCAGNCAPSTVPNGTPVS